jgi:hypothetical protein
MVRSMMSNSVAEGQESDLVLDFDASRSVEQRGNGMLFGRPAITAGSILSPLPPPPNRFQPGAPQALKDVGGTVRIALMKIGGYAA